MRWPLTHLKFFLTLERQLFVSLRQRQKKFNPQKNINSIHILRYVVVYIWENFGIRIGSLMDLGIYTLQDNIGVNVMPLTGPS